MSTAEYDIQKIQIKNRVIELSINELRNKNQELRLICEKINSEIRLAKIKKLKINQIIDVEKVEYDVIEEKLESIIQNFEKDQQEEQEQLKLKLDNLNQQLEALIDEQLLLNNDLIRKKLEMEEINCSIKQLTQKNLIEKNRNNAVKIRLEKKMKELQRIQDELLTDIPDG